MDPLLDSLVLFHLFPLTSPPTPAPSLQTELSLQKEQLQLKIIEIEDEAEKWQKEKDRIKVSRPQGSPQPELPRRGRPVLQLEVSVTTHTRFFWVLLPPSKCGPGIHVVQHLMLVLHHPSK